MGLGESKEESATAGSSNSVDGPMVLLHVYNLSPEYNRFAGTVGMGAYHTGVEISGREYSFSNEGISAGLPKRCPAGVTYHSHIEMGRTSKNIHATISMLRTRFPQGSYDLLTKNCNIFSDALCKELVGRNIPSWINRLARTGNKIDSGKPTNTTASKQAKPSEAPPLSKERNTLTKKQKAMLDRMRSKKKKKKNRV